MTGIARAAADSWSAVPGVQIDPFPEQPAPGSDLRLPAGRPSPLAGRASRARPARGEAPVRLSFGRAAPSSTSSLRARPARAKVQLEPGGWTKIAGRLTVDQHPRSSSPPARPHPVTSPIGRLGICPSAAFAASACSRVVRIETNAEQRGVDQGKHLQRVAHRKQRRAVENSRRPPDPASWTSPRKRREASSSAGSGVKLPAEITENDRFGAVSSPSSDPGSSSLRSGPT